MRLTARVWAWVGTGMLLGICGSFVVSASAQQQVKAPSVITPHGFIVEEVRVGQSCVVVVSHTGKGTDRGFTAVPCRP